MNGMPHRWQEEYMLRQLRGLKKGEVDTDKQIHCAGGCGRYETKMELVTGEAGWSRLPGGWVCRECQGVACGR